MNSLSFYYFIDSVNNSNQDKKSAQEVHGKTKRSWTGASKATSKYAANGKNDDSDYNQLNGFWDFHEYPNAEAL